MKDFVSKFSSGSSVFEYLGCGERPTRIRDNWGGIRSQLLFFFAAAAIIVSRRPDAIWNAQFFAEDGAFWFPDAYSLGVHSLALPEAGYLHTLTRLVALLALLFPFAQAPLVMNLCAITVQVLPANFLLSKRFSGIAMRPRLLGALLYLALPNSYEIDANITTIQWHLALLALMVLFAQPAESMAWRIFDIVILLLISIDGPMGILLLPIAALLWWKRGGGRAPILALTLLPGAVLQGATVLVAASQRSAAPNGANLTRFVHILSRQLFLSSLFGLKAEFHVFTKTPLALEVLVTVMGVSAMLYAVWHGPIELKLLVLFASMELASALAHPLVSRTRLQWEDMGQPGAGNRYFFFPMVAFLASLFWIAADLSAPRKRIIRIVAMAVLCFLPLGILADWRYRPLVDLNFRKYAVEFERAPTGTHVTIPINPPGWAMELSKH